MSVIYTAKLRAYIKTLLARASGFLRRIQISSAKLPFKLDIYSLLGSGAALFVILLFYFVFIAPEQGSGSGLAVIVGMLIVISPLFVAYRIERTEGVKIFSGFPDFFIAIAWVPLSILTMILTENKAVLLVVALCGLLVDPILLGPGRAAYPGKTRILMAYARCLCGILGTFLALTFIGKVMEIGDPKNKKTLAQEILGAVVWGYFGKKFFDFIGVTNPINIGNFFTNTRKP